MAQGLAKRRKLNPEQTRNIPSKPKSSEFSVQSDNEALSSDEDSLDGDSGALPAGASYSSLLSTFQKPKGLHVEPKKAAKSSGKIQRKNTPRVNHGAKALDNGHGQSEPEVMVEEDEEENNEKHLDLNRIAQSENEDEDEDASDPFEAHFASVDDIDLSRRRAAIDGNHWSSHPAQAIIGKETTLIPTVHNAIPISQRQIVSRKDIPLKKRLVEPAAQLLPKFDLAQKALASPILNYHDLLYCGRTPRNADSLRNLACIHVLNHIFKTRDRILKNTARLSRDKGNSSLEFRDQGFTRPKILILLETKHACSRYMDIITKLCDPEQQENKKRFQDTFVDSETKFSEDKPLDFRELFEGNDDNDFRLGIKFTRKTMKYFSQFYSSDIIFASPLGLRRAVKANDPKKSDYDFLSSIEIVVVDQADAMLMQNWEHVEFVFEHLNLQPKEPHDCDFSRVRQWYLEQSSKYLRQTIIFSAFLTPELNGLFSSHMKNVAAKVKLVPECDGVIRDNGLQISQTFTRFKSASPASDPDERFKYFTTTIVPRLVREAGPTSQGLGCLIFIPSYLDFVRVRNYFSTSSETESLTFGSISEYTDLPSASRGQSHFAVGRQSVMLYTGRAHHFRRYRLRGVKRVILYGLPDNPVFFNEITAAYLAATIEDGKLEPQNANVRALFSRWDSLSLERIVGGQRATRMLTDGASDTFEFK